MFPTRESSESGPQKRNSFAAVIHDIMRSAEERNREISISYLTGERKYEKRRIYDLLNVLTAVGICTKSCSNTFHWNGFEHARDSLKEMGKELELMAFRDCALTNIQLPVAAHLGMVVKHFLWIFLYFGQNTTNIHRSASILASEFVSQKKVLRRLYLVTQVLEHTGVVKHADMIGEYQVCYDVAEIMLEVFREMHENNEFPQESVWTLLSSVNREHLQEIHRKRLHECPPHKLPIFRASEQNTGDVAEEPPDGEVLI